MKGLNDDQRNQWSHDGAFLWWKFAGPAGASTWFPFLSDETWMPGESIGWWGNIWEGYELDVTCQCELWSRKGRGGASEKDLRAYTGWMEFRISFDSELNNSRNENHGDEGTQTWSQLGHTAEHI